MICDNKYIVYVLFFLMTVAFSAVEAQEVVKKKKQPNFSENAILTNGTLFYIAISVSFGLWCTGYGLDYAMDRHEKQANAKAFQKYTPHTQEVY